MISRGLSTSVLQYNAPTMGFAEWFAQSDRFSTVHQMVIREPSPLAFRGGCGLKLPRNRVVRATALPALSERETRVGVANKCERPVTWRRDAAGP